MRMMVSFEKRFVLLHGVSDFVDILVFNITQYQTRRRVIIGVNILGYNLPLKIAHFMG